MSIAPCPTPRIAISPPRSRGFVPAGGLSPSPGPALRVTIRHGQAHSCAWQQGRLVFTAAIDGALYARHGTTVDTRLTVIDKVPADDPKAFVGSSELASDAASLLALVAAHVPARVRLPTAFHSRRFGPSSLRSSRRQELMPPRLRCASRLRPPEPSKRPSLSSPTRPSTGAPPSAL